MIFPVALQKKSEVFSFILRISTSQRSIWIIIFWGVYLLVGKQKEKYINIYMSSVSFLSRNDELVNISATNIHRKQGRRDCFGLFIISTYKYLQETHRRKKWDFFVAWIPLFKINLNKGRHIFSSFQYVPPFRIRLTGKVIFKHLLLET